MKIRICLAGAAGHVGRELVKAILDADDLTLVSAVGKSSAGKKLSGVIGDARADLLVHASVAEALAAAPADVLIDYTKPDAVKTNVCAALERGCHAVIGTSGLTDADYQEIDWLGRSSGAWGRSRPATTPSPRHSCSISSAEAAGNACRTGRYWITLPMPNPMRPAARPGSWPISWRRSQSPGG